MVFRKIRQNGQHHIPRDNDGDARDAENGQQWQTRQQERVADFVAAPAPMLEFQGEHGNFAHQKPTADAHHQQEDEGLVGQGLNPVATAHDERGPEQCVGRRRQADETHRLALVEVELGESQGGKSRHDKRKVIGEQGREHTSDPGVETFPEAIQNCRWCHAKRDDVGQRVELFANGRGNTKQTRCHAIEKVENGTCNNPCESCFVVALQGGNDGKTTRNQVQAGDDIGYID